ncbi:hypothetical protein ACFX15_037343 [Malus domestica]
MAGAARPISSFVANRGGGGLGVLDVRAPSPSLSNSAANTSTVGPRAAMRSSTTMAPSVSSSSNNSNGTGSGATTKTQMLRDFSLEIYDKQELQFMGRPVGPENHHQTQ